jgi:hypothetical protein
MLTQRVNSRLPQICPTMALFNVSQCALLIRPASLDLPHKFLRLCFTLTSPGRPFFSAAGLSSLEALLTVCEITPLHSAHY